MLDKICLESYVIIINYIVLYILFEDIKFFFFNDIRGIIFISIIIVYVKILV